MSPVLFCIPNQLCERQYKLENFGKFDGIRGGKFTRDYRQLLHSFQKNIPCTTTYLSRANIKSDRFQTLCNSKRRGGRFARQNTQIKTTKQNGFYSHQCGNNHIMQPQQSGTNAHRNVQWIHAPIEPVIPPHPTNMLFNSLVDAFRIPVNSLSSVFPAPPVQPLASIAAQGPPGIGQPSAGPFPASQSITIQQPGDEDRPPRFRPKSGAFATLNSKAQNQKFHNAMLGQQPFATTHVNPVRVRPTQDKRKTGEHAFIDNGRKCLSNDSTQCHPSAVSGPFSHTLDKRLCQSTINLSSGSLGDSRYEARRLNGGWGASSGHHAIGGPRPGNNRHRNSCWFRGRDNQPSIPLSAYVAATNQLQKRDSRFAASELSLECCLSNQQCRNVAGPQDLYSMYRLEEDDVSLFGSESPPLPGGASYLDGANLSDDVSMSEGKSCSVFNDTSSLDEEALDETLDKLERDLTDGNTVKLEDILKDAQEFNSVNNPVKTVYQTKDFMQWARLYFNSQLKRKFNSEACKWSSKDSTSSSSKDSVDSSSRATSDGIAFETDDCGIGSSLDNNRTASLGNEPVSANGTDASRPSSTVVDVLKDHLDNALHIVDATM